MTVENFLLIYTGDSFLQNVSHALNRDSHVRMEGISGSLNTLSVSALFKIQPRTMLIIMEDKEEALYFYNDLQNIHGFQSEQIAYFPASFRSGLETIENANVIQRAELLNMLSTQKNQPLIIVSYPEALAEKVVNKKTLVENSTLVKVGDKLDLNKIIEKLHSYNFQREDFVYEPGQFALRGGILDIFSFADELPYRIELFGDEVDSIRAFDAESQLSKIGKNHISILPNLSEKMTSEENVSLFKFLPGDTILVYNNLKLITDRIAQFYDQAVWNYEESKSGEIDIRLEPKHKFLDEADAKKVLKKYTSLTFGKKDYHKNTESFVFDSKPQPSFNKNFDLLVDDLMEHKAEGFTIFISSNSLKQLNRLEVIFTEINPEFQFDYVSANLRSGFVDRLNKILLYTDHQIFDRLNRYQQKTRFSKSKALTLKQLHSLQTGDYVTHVDYGIGRFAGLDAIDVGGRKQEAIRLVYKDNDLLYVNIHSLHKISKYSGKEGIPPGLSKLGSSEWDNKKAKVKGKVKDIAKELIALYAKRRESPGFAFSPDDYMQIELESSFLYEDTPDQATAAAKVKEDMEKPYPMDRLVCGDVGFGKTEVAIRAAFKAVNDGKQVAVLVPTTILALQHFRTFSERLSRMPVTIDYLNRFKTAKNTTQTINKIKEGKVDIVIGTHMLLSKRVKFKDLGLLVIDEEQKFGVSAKDKIKNLKLNVDVLTLTATPIPRTLHFSLMGARDLSVIATPPPDRQGVITRVENFEEEIIRDAISFELDRGGQVFFVHNRVSDLDAIAGMIKRLVPEAKMGVAHGQMDGDKLEKIMIKFIEHETNVLVSTNIIESGLDIPNANTIIINRAQMFGLSDLHQMRGRVGRSNKKAFCYLLSPPLSGLTNEARKRLQTIEEFSDLGDGFKVAMRDLDIRGAGNLLGSEQSGFINDLGYEMYHKILDEAVGELKENEFKELFKEELNPENFKTGDCQIETDQEILIPESYISNISERLSVYNNIDRLKDEDELEAFKNNLIDRFGPLPEEVEELFKIVRIRWKAEFIGFEKVTFKSNKVRAYFVSEKHQAYYQTQKFGRILDYIKTNPKDGILRQIKDKLVFEVKKAKNIDHLGEIFGRLFAYIK